MAKIGGENYPKLDLESSVIAESANGAYVSSIGQNESKKLVFVKPLESRVAGEQELENHRKVASRGIPTLPVDEFYIDKIQSPDDSFFRFAIIAPLFPLTTFSGEFGPDTEINKGVSILSSLAIKLAEMHDKNIIHADAQLKNFVKYEQTIMPIDFDGTRFSNAHAPNPGISEDLQDLLRSSRLASFMELPGEEAKSAKRRRSEIYNAVLAEYAIRRKELNRSTDFRFLNGTLRGVVDKVHAREYFIARARNLS